MNTFISIIFKKYKILLFYVIIVGYLPSANIYAQQVLSTVNAKFNTGEKPQSKVWYFGGHWWTVIPVDDGITVGTYIYRLDGNTWVNTNLKLINDTNVQVDTKVVGNITHILIYQPNSLKARLVSVEFVAGTSPTYKLWSSRPTTVTLTLESGTETAVIDIDSQNIMWLVYAADTEIFARWSSSSSSYGTWNTADKIQLNITNVTNDDIAAVTAFGGNKIGVLWSNQNTEKFLFKYHNDTDNGSTWQTTETAASEQTGAGIADDHINFAADGDGTIYAAIKTSYDDNAKMTIGLLKRQTNSNWSLTEVTKSTATRPIALLDDTNNKIFVVYTSTLSYSGTKGDIIYNWSTTPTISFSSPFTLATGSYNNVTSAKETFNNEIVMLYSEWNGSSYTWSGLIPGSPFPVELVFFAGTLNGNNVELRWRTETEVNNYGFDIERNKDNSDWFAIGFVEGNGNSNSPKHYNFSDNDIDQSGTYYYRLKQIDNDGTYEYSDVVSVEVGVPNKFYLSQNYPNPFNPETRIDFTLPEKQLVTIRVYNTLGEQVAELVNDEKEAGSYSLTFDASRLPSGVYIYRLQTPSFAANKKMTLLK